MNFTKYEVAAPAQVNIERMAVQEALASDIDAFLARGGKITVIPLPKPVPRNEHKNAPKKRVPEYKKMREFAEPWLKREKYRQLMAQWGISTKVIAETMGLATGTMTYLFKPGQDIKKSTQQKIESAIDALISEKMF